MYMTNWADAWKTKKANMFNSFYFKEFKNIIYRYDSLSF